MSIFTRMGSIVRANVDSLVSRAEDPEKMIDQSLLEMTFQMQRARRQIVSAVTDEKQLRKQWEREVELSRKWKKKAMLALRAGDEGLAREALQRRKEHEAQGEELQRQWETQRRGVDQLKLMLLSLNEKILKAKGKRDLLFAQKRRAEAQAAMNQTLAQLSNPSPLETFSRIEAEIERMEAEAEAAGEMNEQLHGDDLARRIEALESTDLDMDLLELKREIEYLEERQVQPLSIADDSRTPTEIPCRLLSIEGAS